jgi:cytochrome c-type biogenesis protein CcmF
MFADLGFYLLFMCFVLSVYGTISAFFAARTRQIRLYRSSKYAATASTGFCIVAALLLFYMLFSRDYSVMYIFKNSSNDLPWNYTFASFWSALEGSHFLWLLLLSIFSTMALWTSSKNNEHIMPWVSLTLQAVLSWMYYLAISYSDPFVKNFPLPPDGVGMNALLQNPYMAFHPPTLFIGYTTLTIPFAYAVAALCYGDITEGWLKSVRRWTLFGWTALTVGIILGGRWAYVELGWSGYWAWDPVENSSFMPWIFATCLLHSLLVQEKIGHLKRLSVVLAFLSFFFCFFGTFITRSGVISSVHSFAQSSIGPNYLAYLASLLGGMTILYAVRAPTLLPPDTDKAWGVSKESALMLTQFLLGTFGLIIFIGTMYPIVSEMFTGARFNVQAPYFNTFAPWIGLLLVAAIAVGNLLRWKTGKFLGGSKVLIHSIYWSLPVSLLFCYYGRVFESSGFRLGIQVVGVSMTFWAAFCLTADLSQRLKSLKGSFRLLWQRNRSYLGAYLAHIGFLVAMLGFLGNYRGVETVKTLKTGETTQLYGYEFKYEGFNVLQDQNATLYGGVLSLTKDGKPMGTVMAARSKYPTKPELLHEVGLLTRFWHDVYVVLPDFDKATRGETATFHITINPTVRLVWISCVIMALGGLIALLDRNRGLNTKDHLEAVE